MVDPNDNVLIKIITDYGGYIFTGICSVVVTVFGFVFRNGMSRVSIEKEVDALEAALSKLETTVSAAHGAVDVRFSMMGDELRKFQERVAKEYVGVDVHREAMRHIDAKIDNLKESLLSHQTITHDQLRDIASSIKALDQRLFDTATKKT